MMKWVFGGMILLSCLFAAGNGRTVALSEAIFTECGAAVRMAFGLLGSLCLWSGFLKIAERAGITGAVARLLSPVTRRLFPALPPGSPALAAISMNLTANLFGLGNAATPLGIAAMKALRAELSSSPPDAAGHPMILFVLLNTASLQLLPTTVAALRAECGSASPMEILPATLTVSALSLAVALLAAFLCRRLSPRREG